MSGRFDIHDRLANTSGSTISDKESDSENETDKDVESSLIALFSYLRPASLFNCMLVCEQWYHLGKEALDRVTEDVWSEVALAKYSWAVKKFEEDGNTVDSWRLWYRNWKTQFDDQRSGFVYLLSKKLGTADQLLWMNTESTGLWLFKNYKEDRFLFINLEKGTDVSRVEKKGKANLTKVTTTDHKFIFSVKKPFERDSWIKIIEDMINVYRPIKTTTPYEERKSSVPTVATFFKHTLNTIRHSTMIAPSNNRGSVKFDLPSPLGLTETEIQQQDSPMKKSGNSNRKTYLKERYKNKFPEMEILKSKSPKKSETPVVEVVYIDTEEDYNDVGGGGDRPEIPPEEEVVEAPAEEPENKDPVIEVFNGPIEGPFSIDSAVEDTAQHPDIVYKIIIIGNSGVGKTNLLGRWLTNRFETKSATITTDVAFKTFIMGDKVIKVQFWDTAGQEAHFSITQSYFRKSHGAIIVYDVTQAGTFFDVKKWVQAVKDISGNENTQFLLVGNKMDKTEREVSVAMGLEFARREQLNFMETSALNGNNVHRAFQMILQDIHKLAETPSPQATLQGSILDLINEGSTVSLESFEKPAEDSTVCCGGDDGSGSGWSLSSLFG